MYECDNFGYVERDKCGTFKIKVEHEKSRSLVLDSLYYKTQQYAHKRTKEDYKANCRGCKYFHHEEERVEPFNSILRVSSLYVPCYEREYCSFFQEAYLTPPEGYPTHGINNFNIKLQEAPYFRWE